MYNSTLAPQLSCGRSHWLPLVLLCCCPSAPRSGGTSPAGCAKAPTRDKCHVFPQEQLGETNREDLPCATHSYPASFPNICVQKVPHLQEALVLGMQLPANWSSPPPPQKHQQTVVATKNIKAWPQISASENTNTHLNKGFCLVWFFERLFFFFNISLSFHYALFGSENKV